MFILGVLLLAVASVDASIPEANKMMKCYTGNRFWDFVDYGCYCGRGGGGKVFDGIDQRAWRITPAMYNGAVG
ncbi:hypothetical protein AB6A40_011507 [Gnathostoma spinigerum]|uniref:Phospholipase A(2) n=1 Tax=Gnathostoma spinigerum TaxID=75299 RepID=A0ABD6EYG4_9BILA